MVGLVNKKTFNDLENNFDKYVEKYKESKVNVSKEELEKELQELIGYSKLCMNGEVDDMLINIKFCNAKIKVLKKLLS